MQYYKLVKEYESILLRCYNFYCWIKLSFKRRNFRFLLKNKELRNCSTNKKCFILMGGLSVRDINLDMLVGQDVITANNFYKTSDYYKIKPKYHVITDVDFFDKQENVDDLREKILPFTKVLLNAKHIDPLPINNWYYFYPAYRVVDSNIKFDYSKPCSNFSTVTLSCIQLAMYLGYKNIYLVGFDLPPGHMPHYYQESDYEIRAQIEFDNKAEEYEYCQLFWQYTNCHHEAYKLYELSKAVNCLIFNTSKSSYVRAFPYIEFSNI